MAYTKPGSPFLYDEATKDIVGFKDVDGGESSLSGGALGPYADLAALIAAKPAASNSGKTAMVGAAAPYAIYFCNGSSWVLERYDERMSSASKFAAFAARGVVASSARKAPSTILDKLAGTALSAWGLWKMRAAYAGNCIKVRRVSDSATLDIPFGPDGIVALDVMLAFAGTSTLTVDTFYDQVGANNLTQATAGNQPGVDTSFLRNGMPAIVLSSATGALTNAAIALTSTANCAVFSAVGNLSSRTAQAIYGFGTALQFNLGLTPNSAFSVQPGVNGTRLNFGTMQTMPNANGCVVGINSAAGGMTYYRNGYSVSRAAVAAVAPTGVSFPDATDGGTMDFFGSVVFNAALTSDDANRLQFGMSQAISSGTTQRAVAILQGDSITASAVAYNHNYNKVLWSMLPPECMVLNFGVSGGLLTNFVAEMGNYITPSMRTGVTNVVVMLGGVNDLRSGTTAATIIASITTWAAAIKAASGKALCATIYPYTVTGAWTAPIEAQRVLLNTWLRANNGPGKTLDGIVDFELEPSILPTISATDSPDNLHPALPGYLKLTPILADAIINQLPGV